MNHICSCGCGKSSVIVCARPISRFVCHCLNFQSFTGLPVSDDFAFLSKSVIFPEINAIEYSRLPAFVSIQRGRCRFCGSPVVSVFNIFNILKFVYIPSRNVSSMTGLPKIDAHTFYHRRVSEIDDLAPKYYGYWSSQYNTVRILMMSLLKTLNG